MDWVSHCRWSLERPLRWHPLRGHIGKAGAHGRDGGVFSSRKARCFFFCARVSTESSPHPVQDQPGEKGR